MDEEESNKERKGHFRQKGSHTPSTKVRSLVPGGLRGGAWRRSHENWNGDGRQGHAVMGPACLSSGALIQVLRGFQQGAMGATGPDLLQKDDSGAVRGSWGRGRGQGESAVSPNRKSTQVGGPT